MMIISCITGAFVASGCSRMLLLDKGWQYGHTVRLQAPAFCLMLLCGVVLCTAGDAATGPWWYIEVVHLCVLSWAYAHVDDRYVCVWKHICAVAICVFESALLMTRSAVCRSYTWLCTKCTWSHMSLHDCSTCWQYRLTAQRNSAQCRLHVGSTTMHRWHCMMAVHWWHYTLAVQ
jgi:hypothetical protein